uniref:HTH cro/C1-type domain-containing protein n=1 Tax=Thermosporothrix sp. COM3 TaxID=2490863 RepID=A0A455SX69_9CHLR|nr:hypothetical protein KTC_64700 [Thermosporothrix sp. COM3]
MLRLMLKEILAEKKISQSELARRSKVHRRTIRRYCNDPYHKARTDILGKLATALKIEAAQLLQTVLPNDAHHQERSRPDL